MENYKKILGELNEQQSLKSVQKIREKMWRALGFDNQTIGQTLLFLVEEVGELAKAIRKQIGLPCDVNKDNYTAIGEEAADVFNLLLDICTLAEVDLFDAFKDKNTKHINRVWK